MKLTEEDYRYIVYLQRQLLQDDWKSIFDAAKWKSWAASNADRLQILAEHTHGLDNQSATKYLEGFASFNPDTEYEIPTTKAIFEPILNAVQKAASTIGIEPTRPIVLFTSTDISVSPAARPTTTDHLLFVGPGTYTFCNYWAKCATGVVMAIAPAIGIKNIENSGDLDAVFRKDPFGLVLAARLALYYGSFGTAIGSGEIKQPAEYTAYRLQLVHAMETFSIAHEYAHFVAQERLLEATGILDSIESQQLELFCDELGLAISRECGNAANNYLTFAGIGSLVFFRAVQLCESVRELLLASLPQFTNTKRPCGTSDSHPAPEERIEKMKLRMYENTDPDQRPQLEKFVEEYDRILSIVAAAAIEAIARSLDQQN